MKLTLLIGPSEKAAMRFRSLFRQKEEVLRRHGIAAPDWNHVRLYAACAEAGEVGVLRYRRGLDHPLIQTTLAAEFAALFEEELPGLGVDHVVWASAQLGNLLHRPDELARLKSLLEPYFDQIRIVAHLDEQARAALEHYIYAVIEGRRHSLAEELALAEAAEWWPAALAKRAEAQPFFGLFNDIQAPPFWLDYRALHRFWRARFDVVELRPLDLPRLYASDGAEELAASLGLGIDLGQAEADRLYSPEPAPSLTRLRHMNEVLIRFAQARQIIVPRDVWTQVHRSVRLPGPPIAPGSLFALSDRFRDDNAALIADFPALADALRPDPPQAPWTEADPLMGFRATQYLAAYAYALRKQGIPVAEKQAEADAAAQSAEKFEDLLLPDGAQESDDQAAHDRLLARVKVNHKMVLSTPFRPHNAFGAVNEEALAAPFSPAPARTLPPGSTGNVIVACMKNEGPFILEWIAYHRAIGIDNFLIYTNDCSDGTDAVLGRLDAMGIVAHRNNDQWRGKSPQQHALNEALHEPVVQNADWIIHIDVDEFMNIRTGNGTLADFLAAVPDATNIAMTWRLFGHNGVRRFEDRFVIDQFDTCAPSFCPKPHTVWGFKTMFRNIGAYAKMSCHRPNKLAPGFEDRVKWVNGSGRDITRDTLRNGWRSSKTTVGYDLLQLNHYAVRSAESFLIKRQRGRALHVDRSIGINYWVRMDWSDVRDVTIKRNLPRLRAEVDLLMADEMLARAHREAVAWHKAKGEELRAHPEFAALYDRTRDVKLTETERVAYALALDMES